jgi:diguanylate cyclase (GGDEF)-like protein
MSIDQDALNHVWDEAHEWNAIIDSVAGRDHLTGIPNRRRLDKELIEQLSQAKRHQQNLAVAMLDLDGFKVIDQKDHLKGDQVLHDFAQSLQGKARKGEFVGRFGGDEFVLLLPQTDINEAEEVVKRIHSELQDLCRQENFGITWGLTVTDGNLTIKDVYHQADLALTNLKTSDRRGKLGVFKKEGAIETVELLPAPPAG